MRLLFQETRLLNTKLISELIKMELSRLAKYVCLISFRVIEVVFYITVLCLIGLFEFSAQNPHLVIFFITCWSKKKINSEEDLILETLNRQVERWSS
jgi:hypothetical protein